MITFVTHKACCVLILPVNSKGSFSVFCVKACKKKILQDCLVVDAFLGGIYGIGCITHFRLKVCNDVANSSFIEQFIRNQIFFFYEPDKQESCQKADKIFCIMLAEFLFFCKKSVPFRFHFIAGINNSLDCPKVPVGKFCVKAFVQSLSIKNFAPGFMQSFKVVYFKLCSKLFKAHIKQNFNMRTVWFSNDNVFNQSYLFKNIPVCIFFIDAAIYQRQSNVFAIFEYNDGLQRIKFIDFSSNIGNLRLRILISGKLYCHTQI